MLQENGKYKSVGRYTYSIDELLSGFNNFFDNPNIKIYSIKRLSDGEIFTIGDKIDHFVAEGAKNYSILNINLQPDGLFFKTQFTNSGRCTALCYAIKSKQPLFVTEDGIEIFDYKSKFYWVKTKESKDVNNIDKLWEISERNPSKYSDFKYEPEIEIYFSTVEKAQEYIDLHKPKYSLNDIVEALRGDYLMSTPNDLIKNYIKSRLDKLNK